ncbi:MAG: sulfotransferase domain-containing protein [Alphaproteobacteria bacterium]|jgi:aryl sulfotransferase|nr:sulfotransferase domain-containing protein [Alphaproteobacteria bacterium]
MTGFCWLASYPKSGNTWLRLALQSLINGGKEVDFRSRETFAAIAASRADLEDVLDAPVDEMTDDEAEALRPRLYETQARAAAAPLFRKVHDACMTTYAGEPLFPPALTLKTVYIVRDPRDVAVSLAHHTGRDLDQTIAFMGDPAATFGLAGKRQLRQVLSTWSFHVESWLRDGPELLLLRYEHMLAAPEEVLGRVALHLRLDASPMDVRRAAAATRFDRLRAAEDRYGFRESPAAGVRFFRRGIAGGWRDSLTPAQVARIVANHGPVMARLGYA